MTGERRLSLTWAALVTATCVSVCVAEVSSSLIIAVAATMALAIGKVLVVLFGFMATGRLPTALRWSIVAWCFACGGMIAGVAIAGR